MTATGPDVEQLRADESVTVTLEDGLYVATDGTTGVSSQGHSADDALENLATTLEAYEDGQEGTDTDDWL
jgi:predicted RNase H-like HicB family nuclease